LSNVRGWEIEKGTVRRVRIYTVFPLPIQRLFDLLLEMSRSYIPTLMGCSWDQNAAAPVVQLVFYYMLFLE
jgi:hypothetical protein